MFNFAAGSQGPGRHSAHHHTQAQPRQVPHTPPTVRRAGRLDIQLLLQRGLLLSGGGEVSAGKTNVGGELIRS